MAFQAHAGLTVEIEKLADGDISPAPVGSHVVLEAASGSLLHCLRMPNGGLLALRAGRVQSFQVAQRLPAAALVRYPTPLAANTEAEVAQVIDRAQSLLGLSLEQVTSRLTASGLNEKELSEGASKEALVAECLIAFCTTGMSRNWKISEAYRESKRSKVPLFGPQAILPSHPSASLQGSTQSYADESPYNDSTEDNSTNGGSSPSLILSGPLSASEKLTHKLKEKAISTAVHLGCKGPAAKVAGAAAAVTVEGYALYREISNHGEHLESKKISQEQYQERICESSVTSSARAIGGLAGAAVGQAAIPVPLVGALVGGVIGGACGGFHANSLVRGAMRLSGRAKGGDGLVRCVEHTSKDLTEEGFEAEHRSISAPTKEFSTRLKIIDDADELL
jgi:hypothetical protein